MKLSKQSRLYLMMTGAVLLLVIIGWNLAFAAGTTATVTWVHPTQYTDGSALPLSEIKETIIRWRRPAAPAVVGSARVAAPGVSAVVPGLGCGKYNFTAMSVVKTNDVQSDESGAVLYTTGVQCPPNAPASFKVE